MPKVNVYQSELGRDAVNKSVEVTWGKDQAHVQVGARFRGAPFTFTPDAAIEEIGPFESLHVTLTTRKQVNDVIRVLRKARDQAFGADA